MKISIAGTSVEYIMERIDRRTWRIDVVGTNQLKVTCPLDSTNDQIERILLRKQQWIITHLRNRAQCEQAKAERRWRTGETVLYRGQAQTLQLIEGKSPGVTVSWNNPGFRVVIIPGLTEQQRKELVPQCFVKWYKARAKLIVGQQVRYFARGMCLQPKRIFIREQKTRWGSCSTQGNLNFNWKLIMAPPDILDYVVVHELCHMVQPNHSPAFWNYVAQWMPDCRQKRRWLNEHGHELVL